MRENGKGGNKPNKYNTWEHVNKRKQDTFSDRYPVLSGFEDTWQKIESNQNNFSDEKILDRDSSFRLEDDTPLDVLMNYVDSGFYPPPEILIAIVDCLREYYSFNGELSLEEVFFGKPKKRPGNRAARMAAFNNYMSFHFSVRMHRMEAKHKQLKTPSLEESAERFHNMSYIRFKCIEETTGTEPEREHVDVDSYLRGYRRWKERLKE